MYRRRIGPGRERNEEDHHERRTHQSPAYRETEGPHRTAHVEGFPEPIHFGIKRITKVKDGREITHPEYPTTLDHIIAGVAG
jgi:hypothetical protein